MRRGREPEPLSRDSPSEQLLNLFLADIQGATRWIMVALSVLGVALLALACWLTIVAPFGTPSSLGKLLIWLPFILLFVGAVALLLKGLLRIRRQDESFTLSSGEFDQRDLLRVKEGRLRRNRWRLRSLMILLLVASILGLSVLAWAVVATPSAPSAKISEPIQVLVFPRTPSVGLRTFGCSVQGGAISAVAIAGRLDRPLVVTTPTENCPPKKVRIDQHIGLVVPILAGASVGSSNQQTFPSSLPQVSETVTGEMVGVLAGTLPELVRQLPTLANTLRAFNAWDLLSNDAMRPFLNGFSKQLGVGVADLLTGRFKPQTKAPSSLTVQVRNNLAASLTIQLALRFEQASCPQRSPTEMAQSIANQLADSMSPALASSLVNGATTNDIREAMSNGLGAVVGDAAASLRQQLVQNDVTPVPMLTVTPRQGPPSTLVTIEGAGPRPSSGTVHLVFEGTQSSNVGRAELGDVLVDQTGHFRLKVRIPTKLGPANGSLGNPTRAGVYSITALPTGCTSSYTVAHFAVPFTG